MPDDRGIPQGLKFSISSRTVRLLGRENISNAVVAIIELVKNSYDADATKVDISFRQASTLEGEITIEDDGTGMTLEDLVEKFMVIGTDSKGSEPISPGKKRARIGEKGVGRLALDRLASLVIVETHTRDSDRGLRLTIDWDRYDSDQERLESVTHPLESISADPAKHGTFLRLRNLRDPWPVNELSKLHRDLSILISPLEDSLSDFSISLHSDENPEFEGEIATVFPEFAEFHLSSALSIEGDLLHTLTHRTGKVFTSQRHWDSVFDQDSVESQPRCGPLELELYFYLREAKSIAGSGIRFSTFTRFLDEFKGIRIYRDYLRVKPYGEPSDREDWLGLNARRAESPAGVGRGRGQWRVASNQLIGSILIARDSNPDLIDQTNREGLIENPAFWDLYRFVLNCIQFLEHSREEHERSVHLAPFKPDFGEILEQRETTIVEEVSSTLSKLPNAAIITIVEEIQALPSVRLDEVKEAHYQEVDELLDENRLLAGLASLGIALVAFGHETPGLVSSMWGKTTLLGDASKYLPAEIKESFDKDLGSLNDVISRVQGWAEFALKHVNRDKRTRRLVDINQVCESSLNSFSGLLTERSISIQTTWSKAEPKILGFVMDFESIMLNFITNSIEAMRRTSADSRMISIETQVLEETEEIVIRFSDSGRGVDAGDLGHIFNPMFSTKQDQYGQPAGTGLGLAIVRTIVERYRGRTEVEGNGRHGGATFTIYLPQTQTG